MLPCGLLAYGPDERIQDVGEGTVPTLHLKVSCIAYTKRERRLQHAISLAKREAYHELIAGLNRFPWGRPYLAARKKLRVHSAPLTETLSSDFLLRLLVDLFPEPPRHSPPRMCASSVHEQMSVIPLISEGEMNMALKKLGAKKTAPGPDGVPGRILSIALEYLGDQLRKLFDQCLLTG